MMTAILPKKKTVYSLGITADEILLLVCEIVRASGFHNKIQTMLN